MGQYYKAYCKTGNAVKVFDNKVDGEFNGLKLMEHSYFNNRVVGNIINYLYNNPSHVCWVGDYYNENDYEQTNCKDKEVVKKIGERVWNRENSSNVKCSEKSHLPSNGKALVNHTKREFIDLDRYFKACKWVEEWDGKKYDWCIHPLPLLTCSASHSGGSYYGVNTCFCGIWFNDIIEVVDKEQIKELKNKGYENKLYYFMEE